MTTLARVGSNAGVVNAYMADSGERMSRSLATHVALYGSVALLRVYCTDCNQHALVVNGERQCCGAEVDDQPQYSVRVSSPDVMRRRVGKEARERILAEQGNCCLYCDRPFGSRYWYKRHERTVSIRWDHVLPFAYSQDNSADNFAAACFLCNAWKSDLVFMSIDEVRAHVESKWAALPPRPAEADE